MKVAQFGLPLSVSLLIGLNQSCLAGPQSLLDPYATIKPPAGKTAAPKKVAAPERTAPQSVTIGGGSASPLPKAKVKSRLPETRSVKSVQKAAEPVSKPIASISKPAAENEEGFVAGTKEIFHGIGTATRGAVVTPVKKLASGTRAVGSKVADGAKSSGGLFAGAGEKVGGGFKAIGGGFMAVGGKLKDGTVAVGGKIKDGSVAVGGKIKDGTVAAGSAIVAAPKALIPGSKDDNNKQELAVRAPRSAVSDSTSKASESASPTEITSVTSTTKPALKTAAQEPGVGGKMIAMPKNAVKALSGKLNPFKHKEQAAPQQIASPNTTSTQ